MSHTLPALDNSALTHALMRPRGQFRRVKVVAETGSTNADLAADAAASPADWPDLSVVIADSQVRGRGRLDRVWEAPAGSAMISSVLLRPPAHAAGIGAPRFALTGYGWLSILAGVALCQAVRAVSGVPAALKWPNDVVVDGRKLAGLLAQVVSPSPDEAGPAVVVGAGVNIGQTRAQLPVDRATSLRLELPGRGPDPGRPNTARPKTALPNIAGLDRNVMLPEYLNRLGRLYGDFVAVGGDARRPLAGAVSDGHSSGLSLHALAGLAMTTLGARVRAELPGGRQLFGTAESLGADGGLNVRDAAGALHAVSAGDVVHLRRVLDGAGNPGSGVGYA
ncbi:biotin--[acetyl-CoA-carboxylase] ligase [Specibacter sp. RAF43]|uniref:biotin--[acetyl-CoA-carboxylase] ligase n=1 Tax=Specibacter sp. RAF43 TaxID=3233057 RepID=UPI003F9B41A6